MTTTEDRLTDALDAAARSVTAPSLRPLGDRLAVSHVPADPRRPRRRWLAAVASAAAVAMIATVVVVVSTRLGTTPPAGAGTPPRYYVGIEGVANPRLVVRATATGQVTAVVSKPGAGRGQFAIVADGSGGGGTFFAEWVPDGAIRTVSIRIYRFRVTTTGRIMGMHPVPGGDLGHDFAQTMAVSANGARLALVVQRFGYASPPPDKIIVLNPRTGARTTWAGGRAPHGRDPRSMEILQLSWTASGRELVYLAQWTCPSRSHGKKCESLADVAAPSGYEQVRTLDPASRGGPLDSGRLLVNAPGGYLSAAAISPDGATLTEVVDWTVAGAVSGAQYREFRITPVDVQTGRPGRVRYQVRLGRLAVLRIFLQSPSGQYLFAVGGAATATINGRIADGRLHRLPPAGLYVSSETW